MTGAAPEPSPASPAAESPLRGLRVLDLSEGVAGPFATKLLASLGADVVKLERPGLGDVTRGQPPFAGGRPDREASGLFLYLNTDKRSLTCDLEQEAGRAIALRLVDWAEIVVEGFPPGQLERWGLGYDSIERRSPETVLVSVTGFGQDGPYRDYQWSNLVELALGGLLQITGDPDREPLMVGGRPAEYLGGLAAFAGAMVALTDQRRSGLGQHVDVSIHEAIATAQMYAGLNYAYLGENRERANAFAPTYRVRNGHVGVMFRQQDWQGVCEMMERPDLTDDPRFADVAARRQNGQELNALVGAWMAGQEKRELYHRAQAQGMPWGYICDAQDLLESAQYQERGYFVEMDHPRTGPLPYPGSPLRWDGEMLATERAPLLGEHSAEILGGLDYSPAQQAALRREQAS